LLVEPREQERASLRPLFEGRGHQVATAESAADVWARLRCELPTLVVIDTESSTLDGFSLCRTLKQDPGFARIPVLVTLALSGPAELAAALANGADGYLAQPWDEELWEARIRHVVAQRALANRDRGPKGIAVVQDGRAQTVAADRAQLLDMLLSAHDLAARRTEELRALQAREQEWERELEQRVLERTRRLEDSNRALETFCYSIAHDLRAPLRSINGFVGILAESYASQLDDTAREYAGRTVAAAARMDRMIQDLLAYGRISHGVTPDQEIDLPRTVQALVADFREEIQARGATVHVGEICPVVRASPVLLEQVLGNLLGNALKFVRVGVPPEVRVTARPIDAERVALVIDDNGIGVPETDREKIFDVFQKAHSNPAYPGTGIGLAIVRKAVDRMGGSVSVTTAPGGVGSRFVVELPRTFQAATSSSV
jgi:signal transduction histidine kinase